MAAGQIEGSCTPGTEGVYDSKLQLVSLISLGTSLLGPACPEGNLLDHSARFACQLNKGLTSPVLCLATQSPAHVSAHSMQQQHAQGPDLPTAQASAKIGCILQWRLNPQSFSATPLQGQPTDRAFALPHG